MKCPECGNSQRYLDGLVCRMCKYQFAIDPKNTAKRSDTPSSDGAFRAILRRASGNGTIRFTRNMLHAAATAFVRRKERAARWWGLVCASIGVAGGAFFYQVGGGLIMIFPGLFVLGGISHFFTAGRGVVRRKDWERVVGAWEAAGRELPGLIETPGLTEPPPHWEEDDIFAYGVGRLLICEREELVDLLVRNNFHAENACLVVAESGYPHYLLPRAQEALRENPELQVFHLARCHRGGRGHGDPASGRRFCLRPVRTPGAGSQPQPATHRR